MQHWLLSLVQQVVTDQQAAMAGRRVFLRTHQRNAQGFFHSGKHPFDAVQKQLGGLQTVKLHLSAVIIMGRVFGARAEFIPQIYVMDTGCAQCSGQGLAVIIVEGLAVGHRAHVGDRINPMLAKLRQKGIQRFGGIAYGEQLGHGQVGVQSAALYTGYGGNAGRGVCPALLA